jgi:hypothetical protein
MFDFHDVLLILLVSFFLDQTAITCIRMSVWALGTNKGALAPSLVPSAYLLNTGKYDAL